MTEANRGENRDGRQLFCRIITPEEAIFDGEADLVIVRIADGDLGVMRDIAPTVSTVEVGEVRVRQGEETTAYATGDGFFKVSENLVQVLVEEAVPVEEIDASAAQERVEAAERELSELPEGEENGRRRAEIERRRRTAEGFVHVARKYGRS